MVYDKDALAVPPELSFTHMELMHVYQAAKADRDMPPKTLSKLKSLWDFSRTKDAYSTDQRKSATVIKAS